MLLLSGALLLTNAMLVTGLLVQRMGSQRMAERLRSREDELRACRMRIRDLGAQVFTAQEAERSRIARELHDDIMQQLALLEIDLGPAGVGKDALDRLHDIASRVHGLSNRLHPAKLQLLGLVKSLRALEREQSRSGRSVVFTHGECRIRSWLRSSCACFAWLRKRFTTPPNTAGGSASRLTSGTTRPAPS